MNTRIKLSIQFIILLTTTINECKAEILPFYEEKKLKKNFITHSVNLFKNESYDCQAEPACPGRPVVEAFYWLKFTLRRVEHHDNFGAQADSKIDASK